MAIGNGWIDAKRQYPAYLDYSVKHGLLEENSDVSAFIGFGRN
jgi:carboxypeptidase D